MNEEPTKPRRNIINQAILNALVDGSHMPGWLRKWVYLSLCFCILLVLWVPAILIVKMSKPRFISQWTLILPGTGAGHAVNLEKIGQMSAMISSPYAGTSLDPKVNYKAIAESTPVLEKAAEKLNLSVKEFGKPKIKLVDQSTLIYFSMSAHSAELARDKSKALYEALQTKLDWLREDESMSREKAIRNMLSGFNTKLTTAQKKILDFQSSSSIVSINQFKELMLSLENMRSTRSNLSAELSGLEQRVISLGKNLGLDPLLAADAMTLQQDQVFQRHLKAYAEYSAQLIEYNAKWGNNHPKMVTLVEQHKQARYALLIRSKKLLRKSIPIEQLLTLGVNDNRSGLFQKLVTLHTQAEGMRAQAQTLSKEIASLQLRLESVTDEAAILEDLMRKQQVATAVFTTALAKLDIGKSDSFSSYPLIQMLSKPTLPKKPNHLKKIMALGGAAIGSLFCLIALGLLWIRKPYLREMLMKN